MQMNIKQKLTKSAAKKQSDIMVFHFPKQHRTTKDLKYGMVGSFINEIVYSAANEFGIKCNLKDIGFFDPNTIKRKIHTGLYTVLAKNVLSALLNHFFIGIANSYGDCGYGMIFSHPLVSTKLMQEPDNELVFTITDTDLLKDSNYFYNHDDNDILHDIAGILKLSALHSYLLKKNNCISPHSFHKEDFEEAEAEWKCCMTSKFKESMKEEISIVQLGSDLADGMIKTFSLKMPHAKWLWAALIFKEVKFGLDNKDFEQMFRGVPADPVLSEARTLLHEEKCAVFKEFTQQLRKQEEAYMNSIVPRNAIDERNATIFFKNSVHRTRDFYLEKLRDLQDKIDDLAKTEQ